MITNYAASLDCTHLPEPKRISKWATRRYLNQEGGCGSANNLWPNQARMMAHIEIEGGHQFSHVLLTVVHTYGHRNSSGHSIDCIRARAASIPATCAHKK